MKKVLQLIAAALLCGALMFAFVGCGYEVEAGAATKWRGRFPAARKGACSFSASITTAKTAFPTA